MPGIGLIVGNDPFSNLYVIHRYKIYISKTYFITLLD